jgi:hypothetical protein
MAAWWIIREGLVEARTTTEQAFGRCLIRCLTDFEPFCVVGRDGTIRSLPAYLEQHPMEAVRTWGLFLAGIPYEKRTKELCLAAVQNYSRAIMFSPHQTPAIVWAAVEADPHAIQFVKEQTADLIDMAIRKEPGAVWLLRDRTPEIEELAFVLRHSRR